MHDVIVEVNTPRTYTLKAVGVRPPDEGNLSEFKASLLKVVDQSVQPEQISLWLRERE